MEIDLIFVSEIIEREDGEVVGCLLLKGDFACGGEAEGL